jgi:RNA polymerase sigma-70 factor, ECF subfamily
MTEVDVRALRRGDEQAYRAMVNEYQSALVRLALLYSPSRAAAEDAVQETWMAVMRGLDGFEGKSSLRTWICRILVNVARRRAGAESRSVPVAAPELDGDGRSERDDWSRLPEERLLSGELRDLVAHAVRRLPRAQREVITLRDIEGWNAAEVSEVLGIQDGNQRVLLHRARRRVRQTLQAYLAPPAMGGRAGSAA